MNTRYARAHFIRLCRRNGLPVMLVTIVVAFLAIATHAFWPQAHRAEAQMEPTATIRGLALDTRTPMSTPGINRTATSIPTPWVVRTRTPTLNVIVSPTRTPRVESATPTPQPAGAFDEVSFSVDSWKGGFFPGKTVYYGRAWTALYGAQSDYPRATLMLTLTDDPMMPVELIVTGLDDELPAKNQIVLEINGQRVYQGESWFANWDGVGTGQHAAWTAVQITIPPELLIKGKNRVTIRNLTEAANFGSSPYVLLASVHAMSSELDLFGTASVPTVAVIVVDGSETGLSSLRSTTDQ